MGHGHDLSFLRLKFHKKFANYSANVFFLTPKIPRKFSIFARRPFFFRRALLRIVSLASNIPVLDLKRVCTRKVDPWPWIFFCILSLRLRLEPFLDSTSGAYCGIQYLLRHKPTACHTTQGSNLTLARAS